MESIGDQPKSYGCQAMIWTNLFNRLVHARDLNTTLGSLYMSCWNTVLGAPPATPQQPALTQVCTQVLSRL